MYRINNIPRFYYQNTFVNIWKYCPQFRFDNLDKSEALDRINIYESKIQYFLDLGYPEFSRFIVEYQVYIDRLWQRIFEINSGISD